MNFHPKRGVGDPIRPLTVCSIASDSAAAAAEEGPTESGEDEMIENRSVKSRTPPKGPTEEERRKHCVTHYPPRSWCPECVRGRAKSYPHLKSNKDEQRLFPEISCDYCFPRRKKGGTV
jgi:hypothetical protein